MDWRWPLVAPQAVAMDGGQRAPSAVLVVPAEVPSRGGRGELEVVACGRGDAARWLGAVPAARGWRADARDGALLRSRCPVGLAPDRRTDWALGSAGIGHSGPFDPFFLMSEPQLARGSPKLSDS